MVGAPSKINRSGAATALSTSDRSRKLPAAEIRPQPQPASHKRSLKVGQKARNVGAIDNGDGGVRSAAAGIALAGLAVAQAVRCRFALDAGGAGERGHDVAEDRPDAARASIRSL